MSWNISSGDWPVNRPISQIPECICAISHNATFCNRNVHISVTKWCIVANLWDICLMHCGICEMGLLEAGIPDKAFPICKRSHLITDYSTGVQIVSCTLSDDSVLSESTGLFNPVLCVSQWNLFWQKNQPMRLCLSNQVRSAREWFPSPLGDFIRLFEGLIGELFQIWHWNMFYFFKWHQSGP